jgi:hypothetical protein
MTVLALVMAMTGRKAVAGALSGQGVSALQAARKSDLRHSADDRPDHGTSTRPGLPENSFPRYGGLAAVGAQNIQRQR